ncbi:uncharacterized protein DFL_001865 [Arthrobotrys flagrans]|uniref:Uncharacterized protein n=1 Tax=Arthrobotrys flagrans TaxID=97331 RepID=A0A437A8V0_ARTFL|nr:hypothetical protein DFL_001865 [Arthrobotrys flagrans]
MKYRALGFCIASLAAVANCQSLDPAWGIGHYGGDIGLWYPRSSTTTISAPVPTSTGAVRASKNEKASATTTSGEIESTSTSSEIESTPTSNEIERTPTSSEIESTSTTTKFVTRTTTITLPVTMSPPPSV